jgi:hypothetical protein
LTKKNEVVFQFLKKLRLSYNLGPNVLLNGYLVNIVGWLDDVKLKPTQPQVELEAWAELGNKNIIFLWNPCLSLGLLKY